MLKRLLIFQRAVILGICLLSPIGVSHCFTSTITNVFLGCVNQRTANESLTLCSATVDPQLLIDPFARRGSLFIDIYPLAKESRLVLRGRYGGHAATYRKFRTLFDSRTSCTPSLWKPCRSSRCMPCTFIAPDSWFSDFRLIDVILEGLPSDSCTSQYFIKLDYDSYHTFYDSWSPRSSLLRSMDSKNDKCLSGVYYRLGNDKVQFCVMSSPMTFLPAPSPLTIMNEDNSSKDIQRDTPPLANCSLFASLVGRRTRQRRISHIGVITPDMPLRLVFAVGFVILISGLYSARRWRTATSSPGATAAMLRLSAMWRYRDRYSRSSYGCRPRPSLRIPTDTFDVDSNCSDLRACEPPPCYTATINGSGATAVRQNSSDNSNHINNSSVTTPAIDESQQPTRTVSSAPPPSYNEVIESTMTSSR